MWLKKLRKKQVKMFGLPFFPEQDGGAWLSLSPLLCLPRRDRWLLSRHRTPGEHPWPCSSRPTARHHQKQQETLRFSAFNLLGFEGLETQGHHKHRLVKSVSLPPAQLAVSHFVSIPSGTGLEGKGGHFAALWPTHGPARQQPSSLGATSLWTACLWSGLTADTISQHHWLLKPHQEMAESCCHGQLQPAWSTPGPDRSPSAPHAPVPLC